MKSTIDRRTVAEQRRPGVLPSYPGSCPSSLVEILQTRASLSPDAVVYCFLTDGNEEGPRLTYADLDRAARTIAVALRDVAEPGDRAMLQYAPGLDFISAFFGCLYAGVIAVPAYPPRLELLTQSRQVLTNLATDCQPRV